MRGYVLPQGLPGVEGYMLLSADTEDRLHHLYVSALPTPTFLFLILPCLSRQHPSGGMREGITDIPLGELFQTFRSRKLGQA